MSINFAKGLIYPGTNAAESGTTSAYNTSVIFHPQGSELVSSKRAGEQIALGPDACAAASCVANGAALSGSRPSLCAWSSGGRIKAAEALSKTSPFDDPSKSCRQMIRARRPGRSFGESIRPPCQRPLPFPWASAG